MATQAEIARRVGIDVSSVNKILRRVPTVRFRPETVRDVFRAAKELGYSFDRMKFGHRRVHPRRAVSCPVRMVVYRPDGSIFSFGSAKVREVSSSGAILREIVLSKQVIPIDPHSVGLRKASKPEEEAEVRAVPVRFFSDGPALALAVRFADPEGIRRWIRAIS